MADITWDTFERYKQKGLDARRAGQWDSARVYLLEAARAMTLLGKQVTSDELAEQRRQTALRLLELARDCEKARDQKRKAPGVTRSKGGGGSGGGGGAESSAVGEGETDAKQWIVKEKPDIRFDDVAGLDAVKEDIRVKMVYPFEHPELAAKFGIKGGGGVLMYGPPGTGKTMLAKATAGELDATFFVVSPADLLSKWVGEAEQNIKKLFDMARQEKRAVIFIDEIEALVSARKDEGSSVMTRVVPQILQGMEGFDRKVNAVMFMGATNVPWQLDAAVLRPGRFDEKVYIPLPDLPARQKLLQIHLGKRPVAAGVNLEELALKLDGFSGADIKYICDRSATIPFLRSVATGQEGEITQEIIDDVIGDTPRSCSPDMIKRFEAWGRTGN